MLEAKLILDLGNSQTRGVLRIGEIPNKTRREYPFTLSNRFSMVLGDIPVTEEYNEENSLVFKTSALKIGNAELEAGTYVHGLLSDREFADMQIKPTAMVQKYDSESTLLSIFASIMKATLLIQKYFKEEQGQDVEVSHLVNQVKWDLTLLLPPKQVNEGLKTLVNSLVKNFNIDFLLPKAKSSIVIDRVSVQAEGVMAYTAVLIKKSNYQPRQNMLFMRESNVLIIDIGAGTTDIVLIQNGVPIENSKHTINFGGNNIKNKLKQKINAKLGTRLPDEFYEEASINGKIKQGLKETDVKTELDVSKREVSQLISGEIQDYLEATNIQLQIVQHILVVGGGSMTNAGGITPISEYILKGLKRYAPNVQLVDIKDITEEDGLSLESTKSDKVSPRELNVVGAGVKLDLEEIKAHQLAKKAQTQQ